MLEQQAAAVVPRTQDASRLLAAGERDDPQRAHARDHTQGAEGAGAMKLVQLEKLLEDVKQQPMWRLEADKACDYYDSNQDTPDKKAELAAQNLDVTCNLIKPTVDAVLGLEAKTRVDWIVMPDDEQSVDVADAYSSKIKEAERETRADRACSDAYAGQVKAGFACVEVSRNINPFEYPYKVTMVHRRELYWDWRSVMPDWSDARYIVRRRWLDSDLVAAYFPKYADLIRAASHGWQGSWHESLLLTEPQKIMLMGSHSDEQRTSIEDAEWRDIDRDRVTVFEVWYKTYHRGAVLTLPNGRKIEYDHRNAEHVALVAAGLVQVQVGIFHRIRRAYFVGPHRIGDVETKRKKFPYVPFWGYREDTTGVPYGLIRSMLSPQDEVNARRRKMLWLLRQRRVMIDSDALDPEYMTLSNASKEVTRPDAFIVTNPTRANAQNAIKIDENLQLSQFQFELLNEAKQAIQQTGGVYAVMMGQAAGGVTANSAMQTLIEQGTTTLAELNDNFIFGRREVGERLLELIREDMDGMRNYPVTFDNGVERKKIMLNEPQQDPATGQRFMKNPTSALVRVGLSDVPSTPTYRAHQLTMLSEVVKSLPPQIQGFVTPFLVEATDLPKRRELAKVLRQQLGMPIQPTTPEEAKAQQAMQQEVEKRKQLEERSIMADINEKEARAEKAKADALKALKEMALLGQDDGSGELRGQMDAANNQHAKEMMDLRGQLAQTQAEGLRKSEETRAKSEAEIERAASEVDKERIRAEADITIAEIEAEAKAEITKITAKFEATVAKLEARLGAVEKTASQAPKKAAKAAA